MVSQADKGAAFRALHERAGAFVIQNPGESITLAEIVAFLEAA